MIDVVSLNPFALSVSKGCFFFAPVRFEEVLGFEKLSPTGGC